MPAQFYATTDVDGTANIEVLEALVSGTAESKKRVKKLWFTEDTGTGNHDATLRVYVGRDMVVDFPYIHFVIDASQDDRVVAPSLDVDIELNTGETLKVGVVSGGTASDFLISCQYELM